MSVTARNKVCVFIMGDRYFGNKILMQMFKVIKKIINYME